VEIGVFSPEAQCHFIGPGKLERGAENAAESVIMIKSTVVTESVAVLV
jgi:hypothetical protein